MSAYYGKVPADELRYMVKELVKLLKRGKDTGNIDEHDVVNPQMPKQVQSILVLSRRLIRSGNGDLARSLLATRWPGFALGDSYHEYVKHEDYSKFSQNEKRLLTKINQTKKAIHKSMKDLSKVYDSHYEFIKDWQDQLSEGTDLFDEDSILQRQFDDALYEEAEEIEDTKNDLDKLMRHFN